MILKCLASASMVKHANTMPRNLGHDCACVASSQPAVLATPMPSDRSAERANLSQIDRGQTGHQVCWPGRPGQIKLASPSAASLVGLVVGKADDWRQDSSGSFMAKACGLSIV